MTKTRKMLQLRKIFCLIICSILLANFALAGSEPLKVALTGKYPPFSMYDSQGQLTGFNVDVSNLIADEIGRDLQLVTSEWDGILPGLLAGKYDCIIGSMAVTPQRKQSVNFSSPYYVSGAQLFIHSNHSGSVSSIEDCSGKRLGVVLGETYEFFLKDNYPEIDIVPYKSTVDIFQDVLNGRIVGFVSDKLLGLYQIEQARMPFEPAGSLLYEEQMAIPVTKDNPQLLAQINSALDNVENEGKLTQVYQKWFGEHAVNNSENLTKATITRLLLHGFAVTLFVAFASITMGFLVSVPLGLILNNPRIPGHLLVKTWNDFIRGTPVLIQLFFLYFGLGSGVLGFNLSPIAAAIITLTINASAYMAEVVRSGLMSVDPGQAIAGQALGLNKKQVFTMVVWPQAFRVALPPLMNSVVALIKDTALISVISVSEVIRQTQSVISVTFEPMKYYFIVAVLFFLVTFPLMKLAGKMEQKIKAKGFA